MKTNLKSKILLIVLVLFTIMSLTNFVSAFSVNMALTSTSKLKAGDVVTVTLKISNIDAGEGIDAIVGALEYDKNVFEEVTEENFENKNRWNVNIYSTQSQKFTALKSSKVNAAGEVLSITLKAKDTVNVDSTTITIKDITASGGAVSDGGTGDIVISPASVTINKETTQQPDDNNKVDTNTTDTNTTDTDKTNNVGGDVNNKTNTVKPINNVSGKAEGKIPQTGENVIGIVAGILIISVIAIVGYIKYRNVKLK